MAEIQPRAMILPLLLTLAVLLASAPVSAETYRISGIATYSNSPPVTMEEVVIECAEFEYDCHTFRGVEAETDRFGGYEISIEVDDTYDGAELMLTLLDESFIHIIDLAESRSSPTNSVTHDIELEQKSPPSPVFTGFGCASIVIVIAFLAALRRPPSTGPRTGQIRTKSPHIVTCPMCEGRLEMHLLIRHLIVEHEIDSDEASILAGSVNSEDE